MQSHVQKRRKKKPLPFLIRTGSRAHDNYEGLVGLHVGGGRWWWGVQLFPFSLQESGQIWTWSCGAAPLHSTRSTPYRPLACELRAVLKCVSECITTNKWSTHKKNKKNSDWMTFSLHAPRHVRDWYASILFTRGISLFFFCTSAWICPWITVGWNSTATVQQWWRWLIKWCPHSSEKET